MLKKLSSGIVKGRYIILALFLAVMGFSAWAMTKVDINYNIADYLPETSDTSIALDIMEKEFGLSGQAEVMVKQIHIDEALLLQARISDIDYIQQVSFYNNETYFNDPDGDSIGSALYKIIIQGDDYSQNAAAVIGSLEEKLANYEIVLNGQSVANLQLNQRISNEMIIMVILAIIIVAVVLFITSKSWMEPVIFGIAIGTAILINMGTNIFIGEISYIVNSIAAIIQMALSMDYALVLMHNYNEEREKLLPPKDAMTKALARSIAPVSASSITTIAGLAAIMFMTFRIGMDIGLVLVKAISISMVTVFLLMPGVIVFLNRPIEALRHKPIKLLDPKPQPLTKDGSAPLKTPKRPAIKLPKPTVRGYVGFLNRFKKIIPLVLVVIIGVTFLVQNNLKFEFLEENKSREPNEVVKVFGESNQIIMITPRATDLNGGYLKQREMIDRLQKYKDKDGKPILKDTLSYVSTITLQVDAEMASTLMNIDFGLIQQIFGTYYLEKGVIENDTIALDKFVDFAVELLDGDRVISESVDISSLIGEDMNRYIHALQMLLNELDSKLTVKQMADFLLSLGQFGIELDLSSKVINPGIEIDQTLQTITHNGVVYEYRGGSIFENHDKKVGTINVNSKKFTLKSVNYEYDDNYVYQVDVVLEDYIALIYGMIFFNNHSSEMPQLTLKEFVNYLEGLISGKIASGIDIGIAIDENLEKQITALSVIVNNLGGAMTADRLFEVIGSVAEGIGKQEFIKEEYRKYLYFIYGNYFMKDPLYKSYKLNLKVFVDYMDSLLGGAAESAGMFPIESLVTQAQKDSVSALNSLFSSMETENTAAQMNAILKQLAQIIPNFDMNEAYVRQVYGNYHFDNGGVLGNMTAGEFISFADSVAADPAWAAAVGEDMKSKISGLKYVMLDKLNQGMTSTQFAAFVADPQLTALTGDLGLSKSHIDLIYTLFMEHYNNYDAGTGKGVYADVDIDAFVKNLYVSSAEYLRFMTEVGPDLFGVSSNYWSILAAFGSETNYYNYATMTAFINNALSGVPGAGGLTVNEALVLKSYKLYYYLKNPAQNFDPDTKQATDLIRHTMLTKTISGNEVLLFAAKMLNGDSTLDGYYDAAIYDSQLASMVNADMTTKLINAHRIYETINNDATALDYAALSNKLNGWITDFGVTGSVDAELVRQIYIMNEIKSGTAALNGDFKIKGAVLADYIVTLLGSQDNALKKIIEDIIVGYGLTVADVIEALKIATDDVTTYNYAALGNFLSKYYGLIGIGQGSQADVEQMLKLGYILYFMDNSQGAPDFARSTLSAISIVDYIEALTTEGSADYNRIITGALEDQLTVIYDLIGMCRSLYNNSDIPFTPEVLSGHISHMLGQIGAVSTVSPQQLELVYTMYGVQNNLKSFTGSDATVVYSIADILEIIQKLFGGSGEGAAYDGLIGEFVAGLLTVRQPDDTDQEYADKKAAVLEDITYAVDTMQDIHVHSASGAGFTYNEIAKLVNDSMKAVLSDTLNIILGGAALPEVVIDPHMIEQVFVKYFADNGILSGEPVEVKTLMEFVNKMLEQNPVIKNLVTPEQQELLDSYNRQLAEGAKMFDGEDFSRVIFVISLKDGSKEAFDFVDTVRSNAAIVYGDDETYFAGNTAALRDISAAFNFDILITSIISIVAILIVILLIYRSLLLPIILILIIQGAIWISFSINVMLGSPMFFMAYIIVTCIQMGATIDYGIILSSNYIEQRRKLGKIEAMIAAIKKSLNPIVTSGIIITVAGFTINLVSTSIAISTIGGLLGRGTLISMALVLFFLPAMLMFADKIIQKTTLKAKFVKDNPPTGDPEGAGPDGERNDGGEPDVIPAGTAECAKSDDCPIPADCASSLTTTQDSGLIADPCPAFAGIAASDQGGGNTYSLDLPNAEIERNLIAGRRRNAAGRYRTTGRGKTGRPSTPRNRDRSE